MRRVLISMWGSDGDKYKGQSLTLYTDPGVKFGGSAVGGIRISHATGINRPMQLMLTVTRGKKTPFTVEPLVIATTPAAASDPLPDLTPYEQTGDEVAREGSDALKRWFTSLPVAIKAALKPKLDAQWKPVAEIADKELQ